MAPFPIHVAPVQVYMYIFVYLFPISGNTQFSMCGMEDHVTNFCVPKFANIFIDLGVLKIVIWTFEEQNLRFQTINLGDVSPDFFQKQTKTTSGCFHKQWYPKMDGL